MDVKNSILPMKNSSTGYDELPASIGNQCIDTYVVPQTYIINMSLIEGIFPSELQTSKSCSHRQSGESDKISN